MDECLEGCTAQCVESRQAEALDLQRQLCAGECVGQPGTCQQRCVDRKRDTLARRAATECRQVFCGGLGIAEQRVLGEICLVGDQHCEYDPEQRKHGTWCSDGLECTPRTPGDPVGRCLPPDSDVNVAPSWSGTRRRGLGPTGRWSGVFLGMPNGCPAGTAPRRVCLRMPDSMVSAERADHLGVDAPACLYVCARPRPATRRSRRDP